MRLLHLAFLVGLTAAGVQPSAHAIECKIPDSPTPLCQWQAKFRKPATALAVPVGSPQTLLKGLVPISARRKTARKDPPSFSDLLGEGYNSMTAAPLGACVDYDASNSNALYTFNGLDAGHKQDLEFDLLDIETADDLMKALSLDVSAQYSSGLYSADAEMSYFNQYRYSKYTRFILLREQVTNEVQGIDRPKASQFAKDALKEGAQRFLDKCGDKYIRGLLTGGFFAAIFQFQAINESQLTTLNAQITAAIGNFSTSDSFSERIQSIQSYSERHVHVLRTGTSDNVPDDPQAIIDYAKQFPTEISDPNKAAVLAFEVEDESSIISVPASITEQVFEVSQSGAIRAEGRKDKNGVDYIRANQDLYPPLPSDISDEYSQLIQILENLDSRFARCSKFLSSDCRKPYTPALPITSLPERIRWTIVDVTRPGDQAIGGSSNGTFVLVPTGCWYPHYQNPSVVACVPGQDWFGYHFLPTIPNQPDLKGSLTAPLAIPPYYDVFVELFDNPYDDNQVVPNNPLKAGIYEATSTVTPQNKTSPLPSGKHKA